MLDGLATHTPRNLDVSLAILLRESQNQGPHDVLSTRISNFKKSDVMSKYFVPVADQGSRNLFSGVDIRTAAGEQMMISVVELQPHAIVPWHDHPHEQMGILISGQLLFEIGDEKLTLKAGDCWRIPGGVPHTCQAGEESVRAIDIFSPVREDYL